MGDAPAQAASAPAGGATAPPAQAGLEENVASALCYLAGLITGILFLVLEPFNKNKTIRFHAFQAIFFHIAVFVGMIVALILNFIPFLGTLLYMVFWLGCLGLWLMLMYKAYNKEKWVLPVVGPIAEKQASGS